MRHGARSRRSVVSRRLLAFNPRSGNALDAERDSIAAAEAKCGKARAGTAILHCVEKSGEYTRSACTDRMTERDCTAVHVHAIPVPPESGAVRERLRSECFVRFDQI